MLHVFTIIPAHASMKCRFYKVVLPVHSSTLFLILKWLPVNGSTLFLLAGACQWHLQFVYKLCSNNDARKQVDERWYFQQMDFDSLICTACTWQHLLTQVWIMTVLHLGSKIQDHFTQQDVITEDLSWEIKSIFTVLLIKMWGWHHFFCLQQWISRKPINSVQN